MSAAVQKHKTNSLSLLCSSAGPGKNFETRLALLRKLNVSLMMEATAGIRAAGGTGFLLETLFEVARLEEKEVRWIFSMDGLVATAETDTPTIFSSITDAEGFTVVSRCGGTSSSPPKQRLQIRSPPHLRGEGARVNHFDKKFLNTFHVPGAPALEIDGTLNIVTNQHNNDQPSSPLLLSLVPQPLIPPHWCIWQPCHLYCDPWSRQPSKKAYQGMNAASTVTVAFSTSSDASPT